MKREPTNQPILAKDIRAKSIERRTFLGRFGVAGILGSTTGCWLHWGTGSGSVVCDGDPVGDAKLAQDNDPTDSGIDQDSDSSDLCSFVPEAPAPTAGACDSDRGDRKTADSDPTDPAASTDSDAGDPCQ